MREALSNELYSLSGWVWFQWHSGFFFFIGPQEGEGLIERVERMKRGWEWGWVCVRPKSTLIYDTQTEGATAINMCLGNLQTDQSCLPVGSEFVDCGCGDQSSQTWKDCFPHLCWNTISRITSQNNCDTDGWATSVNKLAEKLCDIHSFIKRMNVIYNRELLVLWVKC